MILLWKTSVDCSKLPLVNLVSVTDTHALLISTVLCGIYNRPVERDLVIITLATKCVTVYYLLKIMQCLAESH